jgi:hypothetical protein
MPFPTVLWTCFRQLIEVGLSVQAAVLRPKISPATGAHCRFEIRQTGQANARVTTGLFSLHT